MKIHNLPFQMTSLYRGITSGKIRVKAINSRGYREIATHQMDIAPSYIKRLNDDPSQQIQISESIHILKQRTSLMELFAEQLIHKTIRKVRCIDDIRMIANIMFRETRIQERDMTLVWTGIPRTYALIDISRLFMYTDPYRDLGVIVSSTKNFELVVFSKGIINDYFPFRI